LAQGGSSFSLAYSSVRLRTHLTSQSLLGQHTWLLLEHEKSRGS